METKIFSAKTNLYLEGLQRKVEQACLDANVWHLTGRNGSCAVREAADLKADWGATSGFQAVLL